MKNTEIIKEIEKIKSRNKKVEAEKAWEVSIDKKVSLLIITYIATVIIMYILHIEDYLIWAFLSTLGYYLSTLSIGFLKKIYIKKYYKINK